MAIRFRDQNSYLGRVVVTLPDSTSAFAGTFTAAPARTGTIASQLGAATSAFVGAFSTAPNRTGTIGATLGNATSAITGTFAPPPAAWAPFTGPTFAIGTAANFDFSTFAPSGATTFQLNAGSAALPSGVTVDSPNKRLVFSGTGTAGSTPGVILEDVTTAQQDWLLRSGQLAASPQPDVVWFHGFESDAEANQFRWSPGFGNDPNSTGANGQAPFPGNTRRTTSDGVAGTTCGALEMVVGTNAQFGQGETSEWWRPLSALRTPGNGRTTNDPGANGTVALKTWGPTSGSGTTAGWSGGFYGHSSYWAGDPGQFDGSEWYLQVRMKVPSARFASNNTVGGKVFYFTRTDRSLTTQEIVTESRELDTGQPYFSLYTNGGTPLESFSPGSATHGNQPGIQGGTVGDGVCRFDNNGGRAANCFQYPLDQWFTILYHLIPGRQGVNESLQEAFIQLTPGGAVRRIWNQIFPMSWDVHNGHNALIYSGYQNRFQGNSIGTAFTQRITQLIFSKSPIPWPQV